MLRLPATARAALLALLVMCACGGTDTAEVAQAPASATASPPGTPPAAPTTAGPTAAAEPGASEGQAEQPQRIVSLSPTATEMLFGIGAGDQVAAVDSQSDYPPQAPTTDLSAFQPSVEAIAALDPDFVVLTYDPQGDVVSGLEAVGVEVMLQPAAGNLEDTFGQIMELGELTGHDTGAADLVADMRAQIDELIADVPVRGEPLTYYHELDDNLYTVTSSTFVGEVYSLAGLDNVADAADPEGQAGGYPQLSPEFVVAADPDLVFLADTQCCGVTPDSFAARPGFDQLRAVQQGRVFPLDDAVASRWGPRVVDLLADIIDAVEAVERG